MSSGDGQKLFLSTSVQEKLLLLMIRKGSGMLLLEMFMMQRVPDTGNLIPNPNSVYSKLNLLVNPNHKQILPLCSLYLLIRIKF